MFNEVYAFIRHRHDESADSGARVPSVCGTRVVLGELMGLAIKRARFWPPMRNMDVGNCLPDNSAKSFPMVTRLQKSLAIQWKLQVNFVAKQMRPR